MINKLTRRVDAFFGFTKFRVAQEVAIIRNRAAYLALYAESFDHVAAIQKWENEEVEKILRRANLGPVKDAGS